jgi:lysophospholipase L1-like esterase
VDKLCGSRCAGDPILTAELDLATGPLNGYTYDLIHFNNGLHGGCNDTLIPLETYKQGVRAIVSVLRRNQPQAKLVIVTSTYMSPKGDESFVIDEKMNAFVLERNAFLREFAAENGFAVNDLYALTAGNAAFRQTDGVHFEKESTDKLAAHVADFIDQQL